jgi:alpha/beta hydrolase family protein
VRFHGSCLVWLLLCAASVVAMTLAPSSAPSLRCAAAECTEWIAMGPGPARALVYRSHPLDEPDRRVRRALVVVHDIDRDAKEYFEMALSAALLAGKADDTIVVAPRFASRDGLTCGDTLAPDEVNWPCEGNSWRSGGAARGLTRTSFEFADEILRKLARGRVFPNLKAVVVAGHSAGGQFVTRYEMANRVHEQLGLSLTYVVANPSSYAYPDAVRPVAVNGRTEFRRPKDHMCAGYDQWPYGIADRSGYAHETSAAVLKKQLVSRPTTYLLGSNDVLPVDGFDSSCAAMIQGATRLERGQAFAEYINGKLGGRHHVTVVPQCGHDARCMFTAREALALLFPKR